MTEPLIYHKKSAIQTATKNQSAFYRTVILPSKTSIEKSQLPLIQLKKNATTYEKQTPLKKSDTEKYRNTLQDELSIDMLRQGYHKSFRELCAILAWQKEDRKRLGTEHPLYRRPLLDVESDKLRFLCIHLNKAEEAERRCQYSNMYKSYLELASFFLKSDDYWLSDSFYEKCLFIAQTYSQLDSQLAAEAYLNIGLTYERKGDFMKALHYFKQYHQLGESYYDLRRNANLQLTRLYMKLSKRQIDDQALEYVIKAYEASRQSDDKKLENDTSYILGQTYLEHNDVDLALKYFHKCYDYYEQVNDNEGFGQASEALAICYQKEGNITKSTEYLAKYLQKVSNKENDNQYAKAYSALGYNDSTVGHYDSAIKSSSKAYSMSLANSYPDLDRNRVLYGIANGLKLRSYFDDHINQMNIFDLLQWKCIRFESYVTK